MKTAEMELNREVVSEAEWLVARKDLLTREKEFTRQRDALERGAAPAADGEDRQGLRFRRAERERNTGRSIRRSQPADCLSFHARPRLGRRLQELLLSRRSL